MHIKSTKQLTPIVIARIEADPNWEEIKRMAKGICGRWLLVGGKVYRTLIELKYGVDVGSASADWDFLCFDTTAQATQYFGWTKTRGVGAIASPKPSSRPHGLKAGKSFRGSFADDDDLDDLLADVSFMKYNKSVFGPRTKAHKQPPMKISRSMRFEMNNKNVKVDFIDANDAAQKQDATVEDYFAAVPLDIQAIALDWGRGEIFGDMAISAIKHKEIRLKNATKLLPNLDKDLYLRDKSASLGFKINSDAYHRCYCYPESESLLFINGCRCGGR